MSPVLAAACVAGVIWAIIASSKRWMTALWALAGFAVVVGLAFLSSVIWPYEAGVLGHLAATFGLITSALAGIGHMRAHKRPAIPKA